MKINEKKLERQELAVYRWNNSSKFGSTKDRVGTFHGTMGFGKTYMAVLAIKYLIKIRDRNHFIIVAPSDAVRLQWKDYITNNFSKKDQSIIEVFTINWILKQGVFIRTLTLILDEIHEYISDERIKVLNGTLVGKEEVLGLTGTGSDNPIVMKVLRELCPIIDEVTEREAIESGYISNFIEYNVSVTLTDEEQIKYNALTKVISENLSKFGRGGLNLANKCLSGGVHKNGRKYTGIQWAFGWAQHNGWRQNLNKSLDSDAKIDNLWNPHKIIGYARLLINAIRHRKELLYSCSNKVKLTLELTEKFNDIKTIIFSQSTSFSDKVGLLINEQHPNSAVVYHSSLQSVMMPSEKTGKLIKYGKTRLRQRALDRIRKGLSRIIVTVASLDRGFDVEDIRLGITASGTKNPTQYKQRGGRVKRKETSIFSEDTMVLIINIFVKNTQDELWLKTRQSKSEHIIHTVDSIEDITFKPKSNFEMIG